MRSERILGVLGMSFSEWREVKLEDIIEIEMGQSPKSEFYNQTGEGLPFLQGNRTFGDKYPYFDTYCTENKKIANKNDVIMSVRAPVGDLNIAQTQISLGRGVCAMRLKGEQNSNYLFYLMKHNIKEMINRESGTVFGSVNKKDILGLDVKITNNKLEQKAIAHILSILDDKIEVNNEINKTLENMAQVIFKQWFVDFEFPNEDGEPYKSSGGEMVESELGMIPKGWEVKGLDEIAEFLNGLAMQKYRPTENEKSYPVLKIKELRQGRTDEISDLCSSNIEKKYIVRDGDIIFSWSGSLLVDIWCGGKCGLNQHLFKVTSDKHDQWFVYQWNKYHLDRFVNIAKSKATTMGHIKRKDLSDSKVLIPSDELYLKAAQYQKYLFEKIMYSKIEIKRLEEIRDSLLPKLMSGEIRVPLNEEGDAS